MFRPISVPAVWVLLSLWAVTGCGPGYADQNVALAAPMLADQAVLEVLGRQDTKYCSGAPCRFGPDRVITTYQVRVKADRDTITSRFRAVYPSFDVASSPCSDDWASNGTTCTGLFQVSADRGDETVSLAVEANRIGRLSVDVHAPEESSVPDQDQDALGALGGHGTRRQSSDFDATTVESVL